MNDSKVVIINTKHEVFSLGKIYSNDIHSGILAKYLKANYPNIKLFQSFNSLYPYLTLSYFIKDLGNIVLLNTTEKDHFPSGILILPESYIAYDNDIINLLEKFNNHRIIILDDLKLVEGIPESGEEYIAPKGEEPLDSYRNFKERKIKR